jgi:AraC-like DNA-binding protein
MDELSHLLNDVRGEGALFGQSVMRSPWSVCLADGSPLVLVVMVQGRAWIDAGEGDPVGVGVGDVAIVVGERPFTIADSADAAGASHRIEAGPDRCVTADGNVLRADLSHGVRTCDEPGEDGDAVVLTGSYRVGGAVCRRLIRALPRLVVVRDDGGACPALDMTFAEIGRGKPGQQAVLDRLLDLLLLTTLREWFELPDVVPPAWYRAMGDPIVGAALRLLHDDPAEQWTVAALADAVGVSRATLARRFTELVGEPPMTYLTTWRLSLAADLLRSTDATVDAIARRVGYASGYGLSVAFTREYGIRPRDHRRAALAA